MLSVVQGQGHRQCLAGHQPDVEVPEISRLYKDLKQPRKLSKHVYKIIHDVITSQYIMCNKYTNTCN